MRVIGWYGMGRMRVAVAAALLLVLQAVVTGLALGASASAAPLDAYGNPICATGADYGDPPAGHGPAHSSLPPCCTLGCPMLAGVFGPPPAAVALRLPQLAGLTERAARPQPFTLSRPGRHPGRPRAPPLPV